MDRFDAAMHHMQQMADMSEKQALLSKRHSALELARVEAEIDIVKARAGTAEAEVSKLTVKLDSPLNDEAETAHLKAMIVAATKEHEAWLKEVDALADYLEIKKQIAELALDIDPNAMSQVIAAMNGMMGDDPEQNHP